MYSGFEEIIKWTTCSRKNPNLVLLSKYHELSKTWLLFKSSPSKIKLVWILSLWQFWWFSPVLMISLWSLSQKIKDCTAENTQARYFWIRRWMENFQESKGRDREVAGFSFKFCGRFYVSVLRISIWCLSINCLMIN